MPIEQRCSIGFFYDRNIHFSSTMEAAKSRLRQIGFVLLNCWLVFHVFAVFISPAGMPPASPLLVNASQIALPYNQALFLNHGYHYFAPDPGASTLISYSVEQPGDASITGRFPNTDIQPRLLYHRYFMLAENIGAFSPEMQEDVFDAYAWHFAKKNGGEKIDLTVVQHSPSSITRIQAGGELSDEETFDYKLLGTWDFGAPESISDFSDVETVIGPEPTVPLIDPSP